jgi:hypothetical protein
LHASPIVQTTGSRLAALWIMVERKKKQDRIAVTEEEDAAPRSAIFNDDGNKVKDVEFVGVRAPDTDPRESPLDPDADPEPKPRRQD